eukprot:5506558-Pleurochrysis_carterae.AAC.3
MHLCAGVGAPVVVVLLGEELSRHVVELDELVREHLGLLEALAGEVDLGDVLKVGHDHGARTEERLEVLGQLGAAGVARVHRDPRADRRHQVDELLLEDELLLVGADRVQNGRVLAGDDGEHLNADAVELVEATPRARLREPGEDVGHALRVHLVGAVHHDHPDGEAAAQVLGRLGLARARGPGGRAAHDEAQRLGQRDVAAVGQRRDDEAARVTHVLVRVAELGVADSDEAVLALLVPRVLELALPRKRVGRVHLLGDELLHHVARVHVDGDGGLDLGPLLLVELAEHHVRVGGEALHAGLQVLLHGVLVALLQPLERGVDVGRPPDLARGDAELRDEHHDPLLARLLDEDVDRLKESQLEHLLLVVHQAVEPVLNLALAHVALVVRNELLVVGVAACGEPVLFALVVLGPDDGAGAVGELGKVLLHGGRVPALRENVDEVDRRDEVEARKLLLLHLEVVGERLLAELEVGLALVERLFAPLRRAHLDGRRHGARVGHLLAELGVDAVEPFRVFWKLLADVLRAQEDGLERAPRALHVEHHLEDRAHRPELALPLGDGRLEEAHKAVAHHVLQHHLVVVERLVHLARLLQDVDARALERRVLEREARPGGHDLLQLQVELDLGARLLDNLRDAVEEEVEVELQQRVEL